MDAKLNQWFRIHKGSWQQQQFPKGNPEVAGTYQQNLKNTGDVERTDQLTERAEVEIIDIKPNGTLTLKGHKTVKTDDDDQNMTLTGTCRAEDVGADNTILSTQVNDLVIDAQNKGTAKESTERGWIPKLLDKLKPF
jgi:flagellar L-ring protein precursor FlgH